MVIRKAGKRVRPRLRRRLKTTTRQTRSKMTAKEQHRMLQLMISGSVFVLLVAAKLLLPEQIGQMGEPVSRMLEQNMDVTAVFSAVGRVFSGKATVRDSLDNVYQAVFQPQEASEGSSAIIAVSSPDILVPLRSFVSGSGTSSGWFTTYGTVSGDEQPVSGAVSETDTFWIRYSDENLPNNVQLQQTILGFDYCAPVNGTVTSAFGYREHPTEGDERFHYGLDLTADSGTSIAAFADGIVTAVGESSSYGKYLIISHSDTCSTLYAHCSAIYVRSGQSVEMGEAIAEMGDTGQATGVHLHFELQQDGVYLNPIYYVA